MNILHMKYALEVARLGSLSKAAETLLIAQPNISRSIKELEASLGITIFSRSAKGMVLTSEGEEFIGYARDILRQIDEVEAIYKQGAHKRLRFSLCAPRISYLPDALTELSLLACREPVDIICKECTLQRSIERLLDGNCSLALVRYDSELDKYYKDLFEDKALTCELVAEFSYSVIVSTSSPLANEERITSSMLKDYIELTGTEANYLSDTLGRICTFDTAGEYKMLCKNPNTFMLSSPISKEALKQLGLVAKNYADNDKIYKDMLVYRCDYKFSKLDNIFITALCKARRACMS